MHNGDYAFYAVADQMIYRWADDPDRNINVFVRPMFTPLQDRNLIGFSVNGGVTMHEPIYGRDDDTFGLGVLLHQCHQRRLQFGPPDAPITTPASTRPIRSFETVLEATYQYEATPWLQIQPDFQYVFNPGAGLANPNNPTAKIRNEPVFGVRINAQL